MFNIGNKSQVVFDSLKWNKVERIHLSNRSQWHIFEDRSKKLSNYCSDSDMFSCRLKRASLSDKF